jgi:hypothetical protein
VLLIAPASVTGYCVRLIIPRQYGGELLAVRSTWAQHPRHTGGEVQHNLSCCTKSSANFHTIFFQRVLTQHTLDIEGVFTYHQGRDLLHDVIWPEVALMLNTPGALYPGLYLAFYGNVESE